MSNEPKLVNPYEAKSAKRRPTLIPVEAIEAEIVAYEDGAKKYGRDQWRDSDQVTKESISDALERHWLDYRKGESHAPDSKAHHLGHIRACCGILLARFEKENK